MALLTDKKQVRFNYDLSAFLMPDIGFLNLGYAPTELAELAAPERPDRLAVELYARTIGAVEIGGLNILEAGSGRGAGASFIAEKFTPKSYVGIDLSAGNVALASKRYEKTTALKFQCGDAQSLPFPERSFDVVINIESSHYYADRARFFAEVGRVLVPGGWFLSTHIVEPPDDVSVETVLGGMEIVEREDITENVVRAMELESDLRKALIEQQVPEEGRAMYQAIFGTTETDTYRKFRDRAFRYHIVRARRTASIRGNAS